MPKLQSLIDTRRVAVLKYRKISSANRLGTESAMIISLIGIIIVSIIMEQQNIMLKVTSKQS
jgi:hypothetical protein